MSQTTTHSSSPAEQPPTRINPRILLLALGMFALGTDAFVVAGVLPVIARETGVTEGLAGQLVTTFSLTYGLGAPMLAAFTGRWPRNRVLIGALSLFCLANLASTFAPSFLLLLLTRVLAGCFAATYAPLAYTTGVSLAPAEKRGQALALVVIGLTVATALGSPLGTWVGEQLGWRFSFGMVAALAGLAAVALVAVGLPKAAAAPVVSLKARLAPITQSRVVLALFPAFLWNVGAYVIYTYIAPLLQQTMHISAISGLLVVYGLGVVAGSWSGGMVADRFGPNRPLLIFLIVSTILDVILASVATTLIGALLILFAWGWAGSILFILQQYRLLSVAPEHANVILALNNSGLYLGIAGGAALGGLALHMIPVTQLGVLSAVCVVLALLLLVLSLRFSRRKVETHAEEEEKVLVLPE